MSKVLIVDDDPGLRGLLRAMLTHNGFEVEVAEGGAEAIAAVQRWRFDAIVLDLMMRGVSGFDVLAYLEPLSSGRKYVVVISAASPAVLSTVSASPIVERVIRKPFEMTDLVSAVEMCVGAMHKAH